MPIIVNLTKGRTASFPDGTPDDKIQKILAEDYPEDGADVEELMQDISFDPSKEQFKRYKEYEAKKEVDWLDAARKGAEGMAGTISKGVSEGVQGAAINPLNYLEGFARGTVDTAAMLTQAQSPSSPLFKAKQYWTGDGSEESEYKQFLEARSWAREAAKRESGEESFLPKDLINNDFAQATSMVLDPSALVPGIGMGKLSTKLLGGATRGVGKGIRAVSRPLAQGLDRAVEAGVDAVGGATRMTPGALKTGLAATGLTGVVAGIPGATAAVGGYAGVKAADIFGQVVEGIGEGMLRQPSRIGPLERMGMAPNAGLRERALAVVGRRGGDAALNAAVRTGVGAVEGGAIGSGLGYLSGGEEGAAQGLGAGGVMGAAGITAGHVIGKVTGSNIRNARQNDFNEYLKTVDPDTQDKLLKVWKRDGLNSVTTLMDGASLLEGALGDATTTFLSKDEFKERFGAGARGVQVINGDRPEVVVNVDSVSSAPGDSSARTFSHELFHALDSVDQLQPQSAEIKQSIVGSWLNDPEGNRVKVFPGLLNDTQIEAAFERYRKLAPKAKADQWSALGSIAEKAQVVSEELGAEYLSRLIAGSSPDALLRGFDGVTRGLLDNALIRQSAGSLNRIASKIGNLGVKPVDSVLFPDLKDASPVLNATLRELVRARRRLTDRMNLADRPSIVLRPRDMKNPVAASKAIRMGLAKVGADGKPVWKTQDEVALESESSYSGIQDVIAQTVVADTSAPHMRIVGDTIQGDRFSPEQLSALLQSQRVPNHLKENIRVIQASLDAARVGEGNVLLIEYGAATGRSKNKLSGIYHPKYSSGIPIKQREVAPYSMGVTKVGNLISRVVDVSKLRNFATDLAAKGKLGPYGSDIGQFTRDFSAYIQNLTSGGELSAKLFGAEKAKYLRDTYLAKEKDGAKFIRTLRLERMTEATPTGEHLPASEDSYQKATVNMSPEMMPGKMMPETIDRSIGRNDEFAVPPSDRSLRVALGKKGGKFGLARDLPRGTPVGLRIDIPTFNNHGLYAVSIHKKGIGEVVGYDGVARVTNPRFLIRDNVSKIKSGELNKFPVATVEGEFNPSRKIPDDINDWTPVGMDPKEHAFFYDKRTDQPVVGGDEAVSVGNTVFVKSPIMGNRDSYSFMPDVEREFSESQVGDRTVLKDNLGYTIHEGGEGGKVRLYGPDFNLLGVFENKDKAVQKIENLEAHRLGVIRGSRATIKTGNVKLSPKEIGSIGASVDVSIGKGDFKVSERNSRIAEARRRVAESKARFPASDGWAPLELAGIEWSMNKQKQLVPTPIWETSKYTYSTDLNTGKDTPGSHKSRVGKISKWAVNQVLDVVRRSENGDPIADKIIRQRLWYKNMTERFGRETGGFTDLFSDLLGAFSPNTDVPTNWVYAVHGLMKMVNGEYDHPSFPIIQEFAKWLDEGKTPDQWKKAGKPQIRKDNGTLFGMNSIHGMKAFADIWRMIEAGQAPKARNFALNLVRQSLAATIDVWAARFVQRGASNAISPKHKRVPTLAEAAVEGETIGNPSEYVIAGGPFGFGQEVMAEATMALRKERPDLFGDMEPSDLQALVWFAEKEFWTENNWTSEAGEGGSFESMADKEGMGRYVVGMSQERPGKIPSNESQQTEGSQMQSLVAKMPGVLASRFKDTIGYFGGVKERSFDGELIVNPFFDTADLVSQVAEFGQAKDQDATFISRVLDDGEVNDNARPGLEIFFKSKQSFEKARPIIAKMLKKGFDGSTMIVDPRTGGDRTATERKTKREFASEFVGIRLQYIPEFAGDVDWKTKVPDIQGTLLGLARELKSNNMISRANVLEYDTLVMERGTYGNFSKHAQINDIDGGAKVWGERSDRASAQRAATRQRILDAEEAQRRAKKLESDRRRKEKARL